MEDIESFGNCSKVLCVEGDRSEDTVKLRYVSREELKSASYRGFGIRMHFFSGHFLIEKTV